MDRSPTATHIRMPCPLRLKMPNRLTGYSAASQSRLKIRTIPPEQVPSYSIFYTPAAMGIRHASHDKAHSHFALFARESVCSVIQGAHVDRLYTMAYEKEHHAQDGAHKDCDDDGRLRNIIPANVKSRVSVDALHTIHDGTRQWNESVLLPCKDLVTERENRVQCPVQVVRQLQEAFCPCWASFGRFVCSVRCR